MKLKRFDELNEEIGRNTKKYEGEPQYFSIYKDDNPEMEMADKDDELLDFSESDEIKGYNQALDDILMLINKGELKGVKKTMPPEALLYVFKKLKK